MITLSTTLWLLTLLVAVCVFVAGFMAGVVTQRWAQKASEKEK